MNNAETTVPTIHDAVHHHRSGNLAEAERIYRAILAEQPDESDANHLLGLILAGRGQYGESEILIRRAIGIRETPEYYLSLGNVLKDQGRLNEGGNAYFSAMNLKPDSPEAHACLGTMYQALGRLEEAMAAYSAAIAYKPDYPEVHSNLGVILQSIGYPDEAIAAQRKAITFRPNFPEAYSNLGIALQDQGCLEEAAAAFSEALTFRPDYPEALSNLGNVLRDQGRPDEAIAAFRKALDLRPDYPAAHSNLALTQHYASGFSNADFLATARDWAARFGIEEDAAPFPNPPLPERRLRVGYVSNDLYSHPVAYFLERVLPAHDRSAVEVFCYANNGRTDGLTDRLRAAADHWRSIVQVGDAEGAALIRQDGIDVLIDLSGHTGGNRLTLFARRAAPVQVSWLGYFGTTGVPAMDYILADHHVVPPAEEEFFTEAVRRLPLNYLCFSPPADDVAIGPPPSQGSGAITFGSFNNRIKITPGTVALWAEVLRAVPGSHLLLKSRQFADAGVRRAMSDQFAAYHIDAARLQMEGSSPRADYLAAYNRIDIALDPLPFGGGTITAECLWMGVPVIALQGDRWAGRIGASFLNTLGLGEELVADSPDAYVAKAAALAADPARLADLRTELRRRLETSPLCDGPAFTRTLEQAYREMWRNWCRKAQV
jgi:protein O-GlcNAc transferase